jgi:hypothetical protein
MKTKKHFFSKFWRKPDILIPNVYFYDVKIQTNIKQNLVKKYTEKSQMFEKKFENFFLDWAGLVQPSEQ